VDTGSPPSRGKEAIVAEVSGELIGIGTVAEQLGVSRSAVRKWERLGVIPTAARVVGSDQRVYRVVDLDLIRERVEAMRAAGRRQGGAGRAA